VQQSPVFEWTGRCTNNRSSGSSRGRRHNAGGIEKHGETGRQRKCGREKSDLDWPAGLPTNLHEFALLDSLIA